MKAEAEGGRQKAEVGRRKAEGGRQRQPGADPEFVRKSLVTRFTTSLTPRRAMTLLAER